VRNAASTALSERLDQVVLLALLITAAGGLGVVAGGGAPRDSLHYVYVVVVIGLLPLATTLARGRSARVRAGATVIAVLTALVVMVRLSQTG
jgi:hypothetical protein